MRIARILDQMAEAHRYQLPAREYLPEQLGAAFDEYVQAGVARVEADRVNQGHVQEARKRGFESQEGEAAAKAAEKAAEAAEAAWAQVRHIAAVKRDGILTELANRRADGVRRIREAHLALKTATADYVAACGLEKAISTGGFSTRAVAIPGGLALDAALNGISHDDPTGLEFALSQINAEAPDAG